MIMKLTMLIPSSHKVVHHIMFSNILLLTMLMLRKAGPKMLSACFESKASVDAALPELQHISYDVLSWAN